MSGAFDAAMALEDEDRAQEGRTYRFDLLAWAVRLGTGPDSERRLGRSVPQAGGCGWAVAPRGRARRNRGGKGPKRSVRG